MDMTVGQGRDGDHGQGDGVRQAKAEDGKADEHQRGAKDHVLRKQR
jgi:hypothetical protein